LCARPRGNPGGHRGPRLRRSAVAFEHPGHDAGGSPAGVREDPGAYALQLPLASRAGVRDARDCAHSVDSRRMNDLHTVSVARDKLQALEQEARRLDPGAALRAQWREAAASFTEDL